MDHDRPRANGLRTVIKLAACLISGLLMTSVPWHAAFAVSIRSQDVVGRKFVEDRGCSLVQN